MISHVYHLFYGYRAILMLTGNVIFLFYYVDEVLYILVQFLVI